MQRIRSLRFRIALLGIAVVLLAAVISRECQAQRVSAGVSSREAFVGAPIVFQLKIENAGNYQLPDLFEIEGCKVRAAGSPSQSSQITIINGRRSESRSVLMQYLITPQREGEFTIPALSVQVDGRVQTTDPVPFVATKSETGDLLFVEIQGGKESVFVGEPLDLTLKIWVKPFRDRENGVSLSEGQMWQMLSGQSEWGKFQERIDEMAERRQRPAGKPVLRKDNEGNEREYFLYDVKATVYPHRPGKIDGGDVQIVVNYPLAVGRSRDPFDSMLRGRLADSMLKRMMDDDVFGGSPFGRRLTITKTRPVVGQAKIDSTEVLPVPQEGRPADYRGAVGQYRIVTYASPTTVNEGDPITLRVGVVGDGPMELVQAPPLHQLKELTKDFKVDDQSLPGYVRDESKVFITAIRPRKPSVQRVPAIPFSFFDPQAKAFKTVYSEPIEVAVNPAETLSLDSIVSESESQNAEGGDGASVESATNLRFANATSRDVLRSHSRESFPWIWFLAAFPLAWLIGLVIRLVAIAVGWAPSLRTAKSAAIAALSRAETPFEVAAALTRFVDQRVEQEVRSSPQAVGALRMLGAADEAVELESMLDQLSRLGESASADQLPSVETTIPLLERLDAALNVRRGLQRVRKRPASPQAAALAAMLVLVPATVGEAHTDTVETLSPQQQQALLSEANASYGKGLEASAGDRFEAQKAFADAADKYRLLVEQGVENADLYCNLGNSLWKSGKAGAAIANYHRALRVAPDHARARRLLEAAQADLAASTEAVVDGETEFSWSAWPAMLDQVSQLVAQVSGRRPIAIFFGLSYVSFWLILLPRALGIRRMNPAWAALPLIGVVLSAPLVYALYRPAEPLAIATTKTLNLRAIDGKQFEVIQSLEKVEGRAFEAISQRAGWVELDIGESSGSLWARAQDVEVVGLD